MHSLVFSDVLVFKTTILTDHDVRIVGRLLDDDPRIHKWNVDREDVDHVLRVESDEEHTDFIIDVIRKAGYWCEELTD
jgi:hypothetical protein